MKPRRIDYGWFLASFALSFQERTVALICKILKCFGFYLLTSHILYHAQNHNGPVSPSHNLFFYFVEWSHALDLYIECSSSLVHLTPVISVSFPGPNPPLTALRGLRLYLSCNFALIYIISWCFCLHHYIFKYYEGKSCAWFSWQVSLICLINSRNSSICRVNE